MKILKSGNKFEKGETINKNSQAEFKRKSVKRKTVQYGSNIISLKDIQEEEERRKIINEERIKDLTKNKKKNKDLNEEQIQIKPAFKQKMKKNKHQSPKKNNKPNAYEQAEIE